MAVNFSTDRFSPIIFKMVVDSPTVVAMFFFDLDRSPITRFFPRNETNPWGQGINPINFCFQLIAL